MCAYLAYLAWICVMPISVLFWSNGMLLIQWVPPTGTNLEKRFDEALGLRFGLDMCADMCAGMCVDISEGIYVDIWADMHVGIRVDMCVVMYNTRHVYIYYYKEAKTL